jgi:hypothetical protein
MQTHAARPRETISWPTVTQWPQCSWLVRRALRTRVVTGPNRPNRPEPGALSEHDRLKAILCTGLAHPCLVELAQRFVGGGAAVLVEHVSLQGFAPGYGCPALGPVGQLDHRAAVAAAGGVGALPPLPCGDERG